MCRNLLFPCKLHTVKCFIPKHQRCKLQISGKLLHANHIFSNNSIKIEKIWNSVSLRQMHFFPMRLHLQLLRYIINILNYFFIQRHTIIQCAWTKKRKKRKTEFVKEEIWTPYSLNNSSSRLISEVSKSSRSKSSRSRSSRAYSQRKVKWKDAMLKGIIFRVYRTMHFSVWYILPVHISKHVDFLPCRR